MQPVPETASAPSTCSESSGEAWNQSAPAPQTKAPSNRRPSAAAESSREAANAVMTTSSSSKLHGGMNTAIASQPQIDPKVPAGSRRNAPQLPAAPIPQGGRRKAPRPPPGPGPATTTCPPHQPSGPNQQRPHRRPLAAASPQAGAGLSFQNTPQTSVAPCPRLRRSRTRRHTWSRTF